MNVRRTAAALTSAAALTVSGVAMAAPASAAPIFTGGLVNVNVSDVDLLNDSLNRNDVRILNNVANDNNVGIGVVAQIAATVCDVNAAAVLAALEDAGTATCTAGNEAGDIVFTAV